MSETVPPDTAPPAGAEEPAAQRALRKTAWRFLPVLTIAYLFNYFDRSSVGFAALTMNKAVGLTASEFGWGAGLLFASYSLLEVPSTLVLYRVGARRWITRIMVTWGLVAAATAFVRGPWSYYLLRFLLGAAEAGFFPGVAFFLSAWFPARYRTRVLAGFLVAIPVSSLIGAPVSGLLLHMGDRFGIASWQWMFIIEGLPASLLGIAVYALLRDSPQEAGWLTPAEQGALGRLLAAEPRDRPRHDLVAAIRDPRVLMLAGVQFGFTLGSYGIGIWLPQILKTHGLGNLTIGFVAAIPYFFATVGMLLWAWRADRTGRKIREVTLGCLLAAAGLVVSVLFHALAPALIGLTLGLVGVTAARAVFWSIPTEFLTGAGAAGGLAFINTIGTLGGLAGPGLMGWVKTTTGSFVDGLLAMAVILALTTALAAALGIVARRG
jgi:sugar phosphate permease